MFLHKEKVKPPKSLRTARLSVVKNQISTPIVQNNVTSPKKVIKALYDYTSQSPNELSFKRGDFFLVTGRENDSSFYEAFNPMTNSRGIVPVAYFQALEKHEKTMVDSIHHEANLQTQKSQPVYGIVLYDFKAERSDELDAKAGEAIIIIAQSNSEWYVAKPIGRLGGPGLIPVSFVEVRDALTGHQQTTTFPNVEEWKKQTQGYEASSIPLEQQQQQLQQLQQQQQQQQPPKRKDLVVSAYIDSYILEGDQYWFIVFAQLNNGKHRVLYRLYEDFYDFQIHFLQEYPDEAGKSNQPRILPYMPGPLDSVNDDITADRAKDLSTYCQDLLNLPNYLSSSPLVQDQLFGIHEGDIETEIDPANTTTQRQPSPPPLPPPSMPTPTTPTGSIKVKIMYKDEIFAIKVPISSTYEFLMDKITHRLGFNAYLQLKSGDRVMDLTRDTFETAIRQGKLTVVAYDI